MKSLRNILLVLFSSLAVSCQQEINFEDSKYHPIKPEALPDIPTVEIKDGRLYVNSEEFFVKGAAINGDNKDSDRKQEFWVEAGNAGANIVRIYGANGQSREMLDEMARRGMYVCFGLNVGRQCNGFDYNDEFARKKQLATLKGIVDEIKDHPAILMWCIGNELEGEVDIVNKNVWDDVNELSQYIHKNDSRPTTIAICWPWGVMGDIINQVPDIDILCINQYDPQVYDVHNAVTSAGFDKPYIVSEFGHAGTWEKTVPATEWGGLIEKTGSQKAADYAKIYNDCVLAHADEGCIGSFVFLWGYQSHGDVLSWYALFDQFQKYSLPAVDTMSELWTGTSVANHAPVIEDYQCLTVNGLTADQEIKLRGGDLQEAAVVASDPDGDQLTYDWKIIRDERLEAGKLMQPLSGLIQGKPEEVVSFKAPSEKGNYRLLVYARDAVNKKADLVSIPFRVTVSGGEDPEDMLVQHDTEEIWFSPDNNSAGYFDLETAARFTYGSSFNQADMDVIVFRGSAKKALTFAAPTDIPMQDFIDNSVRNWDPKNNTLFKRVNVDFDAITKISELEPAYEAGEGEDIRVTLDINEVGIAKTADGHYAMIKVVAGTKYDGAWACFQLSLKTIK